VPVSREKSDWSCACVLRIHNKENYDEHHRLTKKPRENPHSHQRINSTRYPPSRIFQRLTTKLNITMKTALQKSNRVIRMADRYAQG
jgi:hypothetical protein